MPPFLFFFRGLLTIPPPPCITILSSRCPQFKTTGGGGCHFFKSKSSPPCEPVGAARGCAGRGPRWRDTAPGVVLRAHAAVRHLLLVGDHHGRRLARMMQASNLNPKPDSKSMHWPDPQTIVQFPNPPPPSLHAWIDALTGPANHCGPTPPYVHAGPCSSWRTRCSGSSCCATGPWTASPADPCPSPRPPSTRRFTAAGAGSSRAGRGSPTTHTRLNCWRKVGQWWVVGASSDALRWPPAVPGCAQALLWVPLRRTFGRAVCAA